MKIPPAISSPGAILWLTGLLAALVLAGGVFLARSTERIASPPPGNRVDDTFHAARQHQRGQQAGEPEDGSGRGDGGRDFHTDLSRC
ncbi:MAG: hypothetical protein EOP87_14000, partial [Verrucomicrobiaceae bacterium]